MTITFGFRLTLDPDEVSQAVIDRLQVQAAELNALVKAGLIADPCHVADVACEMESLIAFMRRVRASRKGGRRGA